MLNRQKTILALVETTDKEASFVRITMLSFLLTEEAPFHGGNSFYRFVPYHNGPYSFMLSHELSILERNGLLRCVDEGKLSTTEQYKIDMQALPTKLQEDVSWMVRRFGNKTEDQLLSYVREAYPWFTSNSLDVNQRRVVRPQSGTAVYTLGYEGLSIDGCLDVLLRSGIRRIVDVRSNPISRQYGFHKHPLEYICRQVEIDYAHLPELGISSSLRAGATSCKLKTELLLSYSEDLNSRQCAVGKASEMVAEISSVLLCVEADPSQCHRGPLSSILAGKTGLRICHLGWPR